MHASPDARSLPLPFRLLPTAALFVVVLASACASAPSAGPDRPSAAEGPRAASVAQGEHILPIRYDAATGKLFLTIRELGQELLYMNTLAGGLGTTSPLLDRGQVGIEAVVRFERRGERVLLFQDNLGHRALTDDPHLRRSVVESFPPSVLASFPIASEGGDGSLVIDATDFFLSDVFDAATSIARAGLGTVRADPRRSFVDPEYTRAFPTNTEVRAFISYTSDNPHIELRRHAPDGRTFALQQHHSFVQLPGDGFEPRVFHPQSALFSNTFFDFAQGFETDYRRSWAFRWRLVPSDTAAYLRGRLVEPVKPIVYYLDPAIPEPYRSAFREGGLWWNEVFESAGFRNAFRIEDLPEGVDPMDARYSVLHWVHRRERGPSVGPSFRDPRTGEIIKTVVRMDSHRSLVNYDIYMGLLPAAGPGGLQMSAEEFTMARRRQHTAHEIGHTLGFAHNFIAATEDRSSVMDYPVGLVRLSPHGGLDISDAYRPSGGAHDTITTRYAYTWYPDPEAEAAGLTGIIREVNSRGISFITGGDAAPQGSHPGATQWVEGSDMLEALERTMAVRRVLVERFDERALSRGEPFSFLNKRFAHVYLHHRSALTGATKYVGGMEYSYGLLGDVYQPKKSVDPERQREALAMVLSGLQPAELHIPERVVELIGPSPYGYDGSEELITSPAGPAFDPLWAAHSLAQEIVDALLHPQRVARLVSFHARDATHPSLDEVLTALVGATWGPSPATSGPATTGSAAARDGRLLEAPLRRVTQRAALDGLLDLAGNRQATAEVRSVTELRLDSVRESLSRAATAGMSAEERAHRATALRDIERYFDGRDDRTQRPRPAPIPLPWP